MICAFCAELVERPIIAEQPLLNDAGGTATPRGLVIGASANGDESPPFPSPLSTRASPMGFPTSARSS
eukprot:5252515-Pleurochrysis_carterae.AAC.1